MLSGDSLAQSDRTEAVVTAAGDGAVLVRFGDVVSPAISARVMAGLRALDQGRAPSWVDVMPGYASLLVVFDPLLATPAEVRTEVEAALATAVVTESPPPRRVQIPVLYHPEVAPDLVELATAKHLTVDQLVALHAAPVYRCHVLGFRPGFPFLSGLDERLHTPRLPTPRPAVPAGAVAIAGRQAGVYPGVGPGGWRILGRTPLQLFDARRTPACLVEAGDEVVFVPIDRDTFRELSEGAP
jgi:inhibitor of KinA